MMETHKLVREIPVEDGYDVLVAGGGPGGSAAAVCAARLGAKVLLVEATGCLGGMGTSGLVATFGPMADGKRMLAGGFARELIEKLYERGSLGPHAVPDFWRKQYCRWIPFKPEGLKLLLDELCVQAKVEVRFFTRVIDADVEEKKVKGVILNNVEGYRYIRARTFIDATGDAVLANLCGASNLEAGKDTLRIMPATLCSLYAGIVWKHPEYGEDYRAVDSIRAEVREKLLPQAISDGHFTQPDRFMPGMNKIGQTLGGLNGGHVFSLNALRCKSLTEGMMFGRKLALEYTEFYRKYVPGCKDIEHVTTATLMGVRDSRRIVGEYQLKIEDFMSRRQFPDQVAVYNRPTDVHPYDNSEEEYRRFVNDFHGEGKLGEGECYGIPYGVLAPKGWRNLWVAGRSVSCDSKVHGSIRAMPAGYMTGQAAGTAAVQSIETGQPACDLDTARLIETLRLADAYLPQSTLSKTMTR
jgi:hypothetical protein